MAQIKRAMEKVDGSYLGNVHHFVGEHFSDFFLPVLSVMFVGEVDQVDADGPDLPGDVFRSERPPALFLVELQRHLRKYTRIIS